MQQTQGAATVVREQLQTLGGYSGGKHDWLRVVVNVLHAQCYYQFRLARSITPNQTALSRSTSLPTVVTVGLFFGRVFTRSHEFLLRKSPACCAAHNRCNIHSTLPVPPRQSFSTSTSPFTIKTAPSTPSRVQSSLDRRIQSNSLLVSR
jgi:hypothetical protein